MSKVENWSARPDFFKRGNKVKVTLDDLRNKLPFIRKEKVASPERYEIAKIRPIEEEDYLHILHWTSDPETASHLVPPPEIPQNWKREDEVDQAVEKLGRYYRNYDEKDESDQTKVTPLVAENALGTPLGVETIRWRGDPYVPKWKGIASVERLVVDPNPDVRRQGVGSELMVAALYVAFEKYTGYNGQGATQVRAWVMTDAQAGDYSKNINFMHKLGFDILQGNDITWERYCAKRGMDSEGRNAIWWVIKREKWEELKKQSPFIRDTLQKVRKKVTLK
jgi:GNAT superfamily N-acetyltransferase